jgi:hypothetical protein
MLRTQCGRSVPLRSVSRGLVGNVSRFHSTPRWWAQTPNAPLDLDPSLQDLLKSADMAMAHKSHAYYAKEEPPSRRHIELIEQEDTTSTSWMEEEDSSSRGSRKSPAAEFGSRKIGAVVLPDQLQESVARLVESAFTSSSFFLCEFNPSRL